MKLPFLTSNGADAAAVREPPPPYQGDELVQVATDAGNLWIPAHDDVMRPYMQERGTWENAEGELLGQFLRPGLRFLDVGANVGYFSLFIAARCEDAVIHAFEPHPLTSRVLALNAWQSGADITTHAMALSAGDRVVALSTAATNLGDTRASAGGSGTMLAPAAPLDEILPSASFDLVKIDVQGFEGEVVAGMAAMLARSPEVVVVAEFWPSALRDRGLDPLQVLSGYEKMRLQMRVQVDRHVSEMSPASILRTCDEAGPYGQVNLVLTRKP